MPHDGRVERGNRLCDVCERVDASKVRSIFYLCRECAHPKRVRVYFQCCKRRLDFSLEEARNFYGKYGVDIFRTGLILRYRECPDCAKDEITHPDVFNLHVPDTELEFASSVAQA